MLIKVRSMLSVCPAPPRPNPPATLLAAFDCCWQRCSFFFLAGTGIENWHALLLRASV